MKFLKRNAVGLILCVFEIIAGILLLVRPVGFTSGIVITAGVLLCLLGLRSTVKYFCTDIETACKGFGLFKGSVMLLSGLFCVIKYNRIVATFPLLTALYGLVILLAALFKIQVTVNLIRFRKDKWYLSAIGAVISAVCAVIILLNPFASTAVLWMFTGITMIAEAFVDIISLIINGKENGADYEEN